MARQGLPRAASMEAAPIDPLSPVVRDRRSSGYCFPMTSVASSPESFCKLTTAGV